MLARRPYLLPSPPDSPFPPAELALRQPNGLLAMGGDLSPTRLINAYANGIFPWYCEGQPILWWSPDPRAVFRTDRIHLSSRFRRSLRQSPWQIRADTAFAEVVAACAETPRRDQDGSWITAAMRAAYLQLHHLGHAHSVEVYEQDELIGGIYGVAIGRMFFGESMFSRSSGGSKVALAALAMQLHAWGWPLLDAQVENAHLLRLGAQCWPRQKFLSAACPLAAEAMDAKDWGSSFGQISATALA